LFTRRAVSLPFHTHRKKKRKAETNKQQAEENAEAGSENALNAALLGHELGK